LNAHTYYQLDYHINPFLDCGAQMQMENRVLLL